MDILSSIRNWYNKVSFKNENAFTYDLQNYVNNNAHPTVSEFITLINEYGEDSEEVIKFKRNIIDNDDELKYIIEL